MAGCLHDGLSGSAHRDTAGLIRRIRDTGGRHIAVGGTLNFRDTGGYPVTGGGVTRWRRLLRSDGLHRIDGEGLSVLGTLGLRTVLDLRTYAEAQIAASPLDELARAGALTMQVCLLGEDLDALPDNLTAIYDFIIDNRGPAIGAALRSLARCAARAGALHGRQRQDRDRGGLRARGGRCARGVRRG